jgi:cytidine deaminase
MSVEDERLLDSARRASQHAFAKYSNFPVGAALLTEDGELFVGCNIENASYGLTICAERVAVFSAVASGARRISRLAVTCPKGDPSRPNTLVPCGACRQVLAEFAAPDLVVLIDGIGPIPLGELLPQPFRL